MGSLLRLLGIGVVPCVMIAWGFAEFGRESSAPLTTASSMSTYSTSAVGVSGADGTNQEDDMAEPAAADLRSEVALLRSDLAEVQQQLRRLARTVQSAKSQAVREDKPTGTDETGYTAVSAALSEQELREQEAKAIDEDYERSVARMEAGEAALRSESTDVIWSTQAAEALLAAFQNEELSGTAVRDLECRATLCRVELAHRNPERQLAFEQQFRFKIGTILPRMTMHSEEQQDGTISATIYLAREGHDLPRPEY